MERKSPRRLNVEITEEQYQGLKANLNFGEQKELFSAILDDVIELLDCYKYSFTRALLERKISYQTGMTNYLKDKDFIDEYYKRFGNPKLDRLNSEGARRVNKSDKIST